VNRILKRSSVLAAGVAAAGALLSCTSSEPPNYPTGSIEQKYYAPGPWAVTVSLGGACCDSAGNKSICITRLNLAQTDSSTPF
jgi:hypothetical protein